METITSLLDEALSLCQSGQLVEGQKIYLQILEREPTNIKALSNLASIALHNGNLDESIALFKTSLIIDSIQPISQYNYGMALQKAKEFENALSAYNAAIKLNPNFVQAYNNRGLTHSELKRHEDALADFDQAIQINPDYAEAYNNRGLTHSELKRHEDALADFSRAFELNPEMDYVLGRFMHTKMHLCDWETIDDLVNKTKKAIGNQQKVIIPFILGSLIGCPEIQKQNTENYIKATLPSVPLLPKIEKKQKNKKIKLGYFSADFHNHATMHLMAELFERHDKTQFELIAFSFGPDLHDEWRIRAKSSFDQFIDVRDKSEIEIAELARLLAIDIAVDLKGFTQDARTNIFTHRAAPIQVNYLGFPGTMGADYIDYIIADHTLIPEDNKNCYSEKIAYLPNSYQANIKNRSISGKTFTRKEMGLPEDSFIFCSFNNNYKITPTVFDSWMRILNRVENSVLWLFKTNDTAVKHLKREAEVRGVNSRRLVFASKLPVEEHLKRIQLADLFLDTLPYNAHTTASDALRVGLPLLTIMGKAFSSRVAASLLKTVNLQELIASDPNEFELIAIDIAKNPKKLQQLKSKLKDSLTTSTLYNSNLFTNQIESLYKMMYERSEGNLPPAHIYITNNTEIV